MSDLISREAVIDWFRCYGHMDVPIPFETLVSDLRDAIPSVDAAPVVHGRWIDNEIKDLMLSKCTACGFLCGAYSFNFCPHCGAKMDGRGEADA